MAHTLAIITVVYRNYSILEDFFTSLNTQTNKQFHLYIADLSEEKKLITHPTLPYTVIPAANKGYAHGVNQGLKQAITDGLTTFVVVNSDIVVEKNFVEKTQNSLVQYPASLIGGKIYYAPGYEYHTDRYQNEELGKVIWYAGGTVDWAHAITHHRGVDEVDHGQYDKPEQTEFITGCLVAFDKQVTDKVGYWNEQYFLYFEDADFCEQAKNYGIKLWYDPQIVIWHKNAQSTGGSGSKLHQWYQEKNHLRFSLKYAPLRTKMHVVKNYLRDTFSPSKT